MLGFCIICLMQTKRKRKKGILSVKIRIWIVDLLTIPSLVITRKAISKKKGQTVDA